MQANFELAELATMVGRKEHALALHRRVLAGRESLAASPGADPETRVDVARSLIAIGWDLEETGKHEEALAAYKKAQLTVSTTDGDAREDAAARSAFADSLFRAGRMLNSLDLLKRAGDIQKALALAEPKDNNRQFALTHTLDITAYVQNDMGKPAEAMASHEAALAIRRKLVEANPAVASTRAAWPGATSTSASCSGTRAGRPRHWRHTTRLWRSGARWRRRIPPSHGSRASSRTVTWSWATC